MKNGQWKNGAKAGTQKVCSLYRRTVYSATSRNDAESSWSNERNETPKIAE